MLEDYEKDAVFGLAVKLLKGLRERAEAMRELEQMQTRVTVLADHLQAVRLSFPTFGIDGESEQFFDLLSDVLGHDRLLEAFARGGYDIPPREAPDPAPANRLGLLANLLTEETQDYGEANVKDLVLRKLRAAGAKGSKARDIIDALRKEGVVMHDKTVGMTLYRLSLENKVRRDGRVWYAEDLTEGSEMPPVSIFE